MAAAKPQPQFSPHAASPAPDAGPADADAGFVAFHLLLPPSFSDADTMRLYAAVNPLRRRTAALQVRVEPLDPASAAAASSPPYLAPPPPSAASRPPPRPRSPSRSRPRRRRWSP